MGLGSGGRFVGPHQEAQDCGCIRGQSGQVDSRLAGGRFEGPHQEAQSRDSIREQSGQVDLRLAGSSCGTTASVTAAHFGTSACALLGSFSIRPLFVEAFGTHKPRSAAPSARSASDFRVSGHAGP